MKIAATVGLDFAKQVFQVYGADKSERLVLRRKLERPRSSASSPRFHRE